MKSCCTTHDRATARPRTFTRFVALGVLGAIGLLLVAPQALAGRLVFKEEVIQGEVQKPEVTVFLTRQNLNDRYQLELQESFLPKIVDAVRSAPF